MRAMILAAGLGTRMRPLSDLRAKPALPVRGIPVIVYLLELLRHYGVTEVIVNLHHQPDSIRHAIEAHGPANVDVVYSEEEKPLGTGGGIRRAAHFLRESDPCLVLAGDMILDTDLDELIAQHRAQENDATLLLREDPRAARFGTIGFDAQQRVRRIAESLDLGGEVGAGVFLGVRAFSSAVFESLPERDDFEDLRDWLLPRLTGGATNIRVACRPQDACVWEPVGTLSEYLEANLRPQPLSFFDADATARSHGARLEPGLVMGRGAELGRGARAIHTVVWDGESVPADVELDGGVWAGGEFHPCPRE